MALPRPVRALLVLALLAPAACLEAEPISTTDQSVIGGTPTPQGEYPAVGSLWAEVFGGSSCTGTLIRPDVVLTAAHCIDPGFLASEVPSFTLANDTVTTMPALVAGARYVQHELFDLEMQPGPGVGQFYDIGLLFLAEPITTVDPIEIATPAEAQAGLVGGLDLQLVGYGRTSNETFEGGIKHHAIAELVTFNDSELWISQGGGAPQNCHGDSGGPALVDFGDGLRVVGVVSRSAAAKADCDDGGIDTRPDYYLSWIQDQLPPEEMPDAGPAPEPDAGMPAVEGGETGCCSTGQGGGEPGAVLLGVLVACALVRRRARG